MCLCYCELNGSAVWLLWQLLCYQTTNRVQTELPRFKANVPLGCSVNLLPFGYRIAQGKSRLGTFFGWGVSHPKLKFYVFRKA